MMSRRVAAEEDIEVVEVPSGCAHDQDPNARHQHLLESGGWLDPLCRGLDKSKGCACRSYPEFGPE